MDKNKSPELPYSNNEDDEIMSIKIENKNSQPKSFFPKTQQNLKLDLEL